VNAVAVIRWIVDELTIVQHSPFMSSCRFAEDGTTKNERNEPENRARHQAGISN
jgi:hypothetical protein